MKLLEPGTPIDGFRVGELLHAGGMAHIYEVSYADPARREPFPLVMKVPRMTEGDGAENIVGFEVERQILSVLTGPHVPRLVAAGDLDQLPYLVMEHVPGARCSRCSTTRQRRSRPSGSLCWASPSRKLFTACTSRTCAIWTSSRPTC